MPARLLALLASAIPFAYLVERFRFLTDDGYITFRYARNLAEGNGLVYNIGVEPPVEGYSEFLWALLLALGIRLGVEPETFSQVLSISAGALMVVLIADLVARWFHHRPVAMVATALIVGTAPPLGVWATGGMATMPAAALAVVTFWLLERQVRRARIPEFAERSSAGAALALGLAAALLALMRSDAALLVALLLGPALLTGLIQRQRLVWKPALVATAISAAAFFAHVAWRFSVYGDWLPNTARVKLGFTPRALERGLDYVLSSACSMPGLGIAFIGGLLGAALSVKRLGLAVAATLAAVVIGVTAYAITAGGDFMAFARFLVPAIPFAALGFGGLLAALESRSKVLAGALAAATIATSLVGAFGVQLVPEETRSQFEFRHNQTLKRVEKAETELAQWENMKTRAEDWAVAGRALRDHVQPGESLVAGAIGALGYYSGLFIYDRNGLVTREVAMRKPNKDLRSPGHDKVVPRNFFFKYRPTYINAGICEEANWPPTRGSIKLGPTERPGTVVWLVRGAKH